MNNQHLQIDFNYFINNDFDKQKIIVSSNLFEFEIHPSQHKESIKLTLKDIQLNDHIYDFLLKRIFVSEHRYRIKYVFNHLWYLKNNQKSNNCLDQIVGEIDQKNWFFLEEYVIDSRLKKRHGNYKPRLFLLFLKNNKCLYPLFVDTEHLITSKNETRNNIN